MTEARPEKSGTGLLRFSATRVRTGLRASEVSQLNPGNLLEASDGCPLRMPVGGFLVEELRPRRLGCGGGDFLLHARWHASCLVALERK
jgi:hypothetical protein